ncbi:MAG: SRPBCC family protein [Bdellovibrionota bacterium]|nr:SRPBCC family protein [Bdellovibrionota bacterium]
MMQEIKITKEIPVSAPLGLIKNIILDTRNYPSFINSIHKSYIHEEGENFSDALFYAKILMFPIQFRILTKEEGASQISFVQTSGYFVKLEGTWDLEEQGDKVLLKYSAAIRFPPGALPKVVKACQEVFFPEMIDLFKFEIEQRIKIAA